MKTYQIVAILFVLVYYAFIIGLSLYRKKIKSEEDYFLASRTFPAWILTFSYAASWFGGAAGIISADRAYAGGLSAFFVMGGPTVVSGVFLLFLARRIRIFAPISQPVMMEARYSATVRTVQSLIIFWYMITWAASQMIGAADFFGGFFGMGYTRALFCVVLVVWFYCMFGGFKSVVTTDLGQFIWIIVSLVILLVVALFASGGFGNVIDLVAQKRDTHYFNFFSNFKYSVFYIISFTFAWVISAEIWQRFSAARSVLDAKKMSWGALLINVPLYLLVVLIGMLALAIFPEKQPEGHIMTALITGYTPSLFAGIAFAGLLAALMSTMDTALNTGSLILTEDIYHRLINPEATDAQLVIFGRIGVTVMAICGIVISLTVKDLLWVLWMASDILASGVFWPLILGIYSSRGTTTGALISMLGGGLFVAWNYLIDLGVALPGIIPAWPGKSWPFSIFWGIVIGLVLYVAASLLTQSDRERQKADEFLKIFSKNA